MSHQRILCYLHSFEPGGVERTALSLCRAWHERGEDVIVVMGRDAGRAASGAPDLRYRWLPRPGFSTAPFETLWMILFLPLIVLRTRPDVIFCAGNSYTIVAVMLKVLLGKRSPPIVAKISNDLDRPDLVQPVRWFYHLWCRIQGRAIDHLVALSPAMADQVRTIARARAETVSALPDAVLDDARAGSLAKAGALARASSTDGVRFLALGRLAPQKDFSTLLDAFAIGADAADRLCIVGDGPERKRLERHIDRRGLRGRVTLPGHSARIEDWIARSDVFVLSSRYEGLPAVVIEAMAAGLPVIATDCCSSMASLVGYGAFGCLVPRSEVAALALAISAPLPALDPRPAARHALINTIDRVAELYLSLFLKTVAAHQRSDRHEAIFERGFLPR